MFGRNDKYIYTLIAYTLGNFLWKSRFLRVEMKPKPIYIRLKICEIIEKLFAQRVDFFEYRSSWAPFNYLYHYFVHHSVE